MKKIINLCIGGILMLSLFTIGVNAASSNFSFYFNGAYVEGDVNGVYYDIGGDDLTVTATGKWFLTRGNTLGSQEATCGISLKRSTFWTDADYGYESIGTTSILNGYYQGPSVSFNISWDAGAASDEYYLVTSCGVGSGDTYKSGSGTLSW